MDRKERYEQLQEKIIELTRQPKRKIELKAVMDIGGMIKA